MRHKRIYELWSWNLHSALHNEGKSDEHAVRWTHCYRHADRMGSRCSGERLGQEIVDAAILAGIQSATPLGPANLAGTRSDSTIMQHEWCRSPIQRIYGRDQDRFAVAVMPRRVTASRGRMH